MAAIIAGGLGLGAWTSSPQEAADRLAEAQPAPTSRGGAAMQEAIGLPVKGADVSVSRSSSGVSALADASFIKATGIADAWKLLREDVAGTIAIVDTGVDLKSDTLKPYLIEGVNLLNRALPPQDDNGHGTAVAGVIAAAAEAAKGTGKAAWRMKLMPVKALDENGEGDEAQLASGLRYAIAHGADIVVLSLGLRRDAPDMRAAVELAEQQGVLLVAASGNDAAAFGDRAAVQYPAAYPTVIAVSGAEAGQGQAHATGGPEVDLAASWRVDTLKLGGGRLAMEGTSMAAPQVAVAAAMLRAAHPGWKPALLRETLRRTAEDIGAAGRDDATGYGMLRADLAVAAVPLADWREPNGAQRTASAFPPGTEVYAAWSGDPDTDWYVLESRYDGVLSVRLQTTLFDAGAGAVKLSLYKAGASRPVAAAGTGREGVTSWQLGKGKYYLRADGSSRSSPRAYRLTSSFRMLPDRTETSGDSHAAYVVEPRTQRWVGTFDRQGDEDWTAIKLPQAGSLRVTVETDTTRIDPAVVLQRAGQSPAWTDELGDGQSETAAIKAAAAGKYYIGVRNAAADGAPPVVGTYTVTLEYITTYPDIGEPNGGPLTAASLSKGAAGTLKGLISARDDEDWYRFKATGGTYEWAVSDIPDGSIFRLTIYDKALKPLGEWTNKTGGAAIAARQKLASGTYYARIAADRADASAYYRIGVADAK